MSLQDTLRAAGLKFEEKGGMLWGGFEIPPNRTQIFILDPDADDLLGYKEHDFLSPVGPANDAAKVKRVCEIMGKKKRGGVVVIGDACMVKFEIPASMDGPAMWEEVRGLCHIADGVEKEVFGTDNM